jgi:hypothetical protein
MRRITMSNEPTESGWKRFLDRLKQLLGKTGDGVPTTASPHDWKFGKVKAVRLRVGSQG